MPHFVVAPGEGTELPEGVEMTGDYDVDAGVVVETMYGMMDTDGSGELSLEELSTWIVHIHVPAMPEDGCMDAGMDGGCMDAGCGGC